MEKKIKRLIRFLYEFIVIFVFGRKCVPVRFFSSKKNVGDALNFYLIHKISNRSVFEVKMGGVRHILGIGSIIHLGSGKSLVWGAGLIEEGIVLDQKTLASMKFFAVRGKKTRELIARKIGRSLSCTLGDPAVLMPIYYMPNVKKRYALGIVPHYVDKESRGFKRLLELTSAKVIDVELPVEAFIDELSECEVIISSSLHGLILADSYNIPNVWVQFSNNLIGGDFKFLDYYTTTSEKQRQPVELIDYNFSVDKVNSLLAGANIAKFTEDRDLLIKCFPLNI